MLVAAAHNLLRDVVEADPDHLCVLAPDGTIQATNAAWQAFAEANGAEPGLGLGVRYLDVCAAAGEDPWATRAHAGVGAVLAGSRAIFRLEYPCHAPWGQERWFTLVAVPLPGGGAILSHTDSTESHKVCDQLRHRALRHPATGLCTPAAFEERVDATLRATAGTGLSTVVAHLPAPGPPDEGALARTADELRGLLGRRETVGHSATGGLAVLTTSEDPLRCAAELVAVLGEGTGVAVSGPETRSARLLVSVAAGRAA